MKRIAWIAGVLALPGIGHGGAGGQESGTLIAHEWGTFTVLQDERGRALSGVNINEEALPRFVHRLSGGLVPDSHRYTPVLGSGQYARYASKGIPRIYPAVAMRMETPIIYFYPPKGRTAPLTLDVEVKFRRGWISEWYPDAAVDAPGFLVKKDRPSVVGTITPKTVGSIRWENLTVTPLSSVGGSVRLPETDEHVWLAPRKVGSAIVTTRNGQSEKYLFYRGVADLPSPVRVVRSKDGSSLDVTSRFPKNAAVRIGAAYLVDIREDGLRFRELGAMDIPTGSTGRTILSTPASFTPKDGRGLGPLWDSMRSALIEDGLYGDEAEALLNTWKLSYFTSKGLRLFFTLPREWTDRVLPLTLSEKASVDRVMIGRIEIVTPEQRALIERIAKGPASDRGWFRNALKRLPDEEQQEFTKDLHQGRRGLDALGVEIPGDYKAYMALGRFRDALVLDAARDASKPALRDFARNYGLEYFQPARASIGW